MLTKLLKRERESRGREVRKTMRRLKLVTLAVMIVALGSLAICPRIATAGEVTPFKTIKTIIDYARNSLGVLIGQNSYSITKGVDLAGNEYTTTRTVSYAVINGKAYADTSLTVTVSRDEQGSWSISIEQVTYLRDENGRFIGDGAKGTRKILSYDAETQTCSLKEGDLAFTLINGRPEITKFTFKEATWGVELKKGEVEADEKNIKEFLEGIDFTELKPGTSSDLISYSEGTTTYSYITISGVNKLEDINTTGTTWSFADGTPPEEYEASVCPLDGGKWAFAHFSSHTHFAYDTKGNLIETPDEIEFHRDDNGTADDSEDDRVWVTINGKVVEGVADIKEYIQETYGGNVSYTISTTSGVRKDAEEGWVVYNERSFTAFALHNGNLLPDFTFTEYHNSPIQETTTTTIDPRVDGKVVSTVYCPPKTHVEGSTQFTKKETLWIFVQDADGVLWALKIVDPNLISEARAYKAGDSISINGDIIEGNILQVTEIH